MEEFILFAKPWWVNLFILIPFIAYFVWKKKGGLALTWKTLLIAAAFGISFGFVEAVVVVYLRAAVGLLPGYGGTLTDVATLSSTIYQQAKILAELPKNLVLVEFFREAATMVMLVAIAQLGAKSARERWALWIWVFAIWDIFYYFGLWTTVRWPSSLLTSDVLFLIPVPWFSQVWYPILTSILAVIAVAAAKQKSQTKISDESTSV